MISSLKRLKYLIGIISLITVSVSGQEGKKPMLKKSELRKYNRDLKKANKTIQSKTLELTKLVNDQKGSLDIEKIEFRIDSLTRLQLSVDDSTRFKIEERLSKLEDLQHKLNGKEIRSTNRELNQKINSLKQDLKISQQLNKKDIKAYEELTKSIDQLQEIEFNLKELNNLEAEFESLKSLAKTSFEPIQTNLKSLEVDMDSYGKDLESYKRNLSGWDKALENRIQHLEAGKYLSEQKNKMINPENELQSLQSNFDGQQGKDFVTKKIQDRFSRLLEEEGPDALAKKLNKGHEKLTTLKEKRNEVQDITNVPKKRPNPYKAKPFKERLSFGGNLQVNRNQPVSLDAGLELAYQLNARSEYGLGTSMRVRLQKPTPQTQINSNEVLSFRSFYHYQLLSSIGFQANYEVNRTLPSSTFNNAEQPVEQWTQSALIGLRKEQKFFQGLAGYMTIQYDLLRAAESPNPKFVFRFGFRLN